MRFVPACALDPDGVSSYALFGELKKKKLQWPAGITIQLLACRPHSRGSVSIRSNDPNDRPQVNINYFEREADMKTLIEGVRLARKLAEAEPLAQYLTAECFPGLEKTEDAQLEEFVRRTVHSGNALVGTCRMGASPADGSVVSSQDFKVHGVQGLRVVDASLIPVIPGGQTGAATVMIAERAAAVVTGRRQPITQTTAATLPQLAFA